MQMYGMGFTSICPLQGLSDGTAEVLCCISRELKFKEQLIDIISPRLVIMFGAIAISLPSGLLAVLVVHALARDDTAERQELNT